MDFSKIKLELKVFFKRINYIHIIALCLILIGIANYLAQGESIGKGYSEEAKIIGIKSIATQLPLVSINLLPKDIDIDETVEFTYLFSKFDLSIIKGKTIKTVFRDGIKKYLIVYEIEGGLEQYLNIKDALSNSIVNKKDKGSGVFEVDNLGIFSFYYNDPDRRQTVYQVALIGGRIWGFEYPRVRHEEMKIFTKSVADNY